VREDLEQTLEILSSFCRDFVLIKERGNRNLLLNPDFEEEIRRAEELLSLEQSLGCLAAVDAVLSGLSRNLNLSLLLSSFLSYFMEREYV
jgi:DNA polymerase-3 subunit delta'